MNCQAILIAGSAGSVSAVKKILEGLKPDFRIPIVVVQHLPASLRLDVKLVYENEAGLIPVLIEDKMILEERKIYFAPANYHVLFEHNFSLSLNVDPPVNFSRPSIEVFFESVVTHVNKDLIIILLTGANEDGALGLSELQKIGATTIVQDPAEAEVPIMPQAALKLNSKHLILKLDAIINRLNVL